MPGQVTIPLDRPPISGQFEEVFFDLDGTWRGQTWNFALFTTSSGDKWVGHFRSKESDNFKVAELSSKKIACIISGGHGYVVDIDRKLRLKDLEHDMVLDLVADDQTSSFYYSTYWDIMRIDENLNEIEMNIPADPDGIFFADKIARKQFLKVDEIGDTKTNEDLFIDLDKQTISRRH